MAPSPHTRLLDRYPVDTDEDKEPEVITARVTVREHPYVAPYRPLEVMSDFWDCRGRRQHMGVDLQGVGENAGLGTPIVAMARSRIVAVGRPEDSPSRYGRPLTNRSSTQRGGETLPTSADIEGYGQVWFFTSSYGSWRTGAIITTEILDGPLAGHRVRYMHLGAIRPDLNPGMIVEAGEEIGVMGGTAIQTSAPHVHIDIEDPDGERVDPAPYIGLPVRTDQDTPDC